MALLKFKRSATPSKVPTTSDLALGELALNTYDGKLYMKKDDGTQAIVEVGGTSGGGTVTSVDVSGGTTGLTFSGGPVTSSGTITQGGTLNVANGGTGATSLTSGYVLKGNGTSPLSASVIYDNGTNVGIGTSSPASGIDVIANSGGYFRGSSAGIIVLDDTGVADASTPMRWMSSDGGSQIFYAANRNASNNRTTGSVEHMRINASGNVGIGVTAPARQLHVHTTSGDVYAEFTNGTTGTTFADGLQIGVQAGTNDAIINNKEASNTRFWTSGTERMRITSAGSVGIGTTSPDSKVDIEAANSQLRLTDSDDSKFVEFSYSGGKLITRNNSTSTTVNQFTLDESGRLGIGTTSPSQTLQVQGTGYATSDFRAPIFYDSNDTAYYVDPASTSALNGLTSYGDLIISKADARLKLYDSTGTSGNNPYVEWETTANQGIAMELNVYDGELPVSGYGLVVREGPSNGQFPTTGTLTFNVLGEMYTGGTTLSSLNKVFHDGYHPNADRLTTARTISLTGDVSGSTSFNGSANVSITATVADDSHNHIISNVDGLQTALDGKLSTTGKAADSNLFDNLDSVRFVYGSNQYATSDGRTDINNLSKTGHYWSSSATNKPSTGNGTTFHINHDGGTSYATQMFINHDGNDGAYFRAKDAGTWNSWQRIFSDGYAPFNNLTSKTSGTGTYQTSGDFRAPIFYDSNDTGYYINPASTSYVNAMLSYSYQGNGNVGGTGSASWHPSGIYSAGYNWLYGGISAGGGDISSVNSVYANIYYDSGNTAYYVNPASTSYVSGEFRVQQSGTNGFRILSPTGTQSLWVRAGYDTDGTGTPISSPTNIQFQSSGSSGGSFTFVSGNTKALTITSNYAQGAGSLRAPIFYDTANTAFYFDGASTTNINELSGNGKQMFVTTDTFLRINQSSTFSNGVWLGSSHLKQGSSAYAAFGGNGGTTNSRVYIYGGTYNGSNVISIDGSNGRVTALDSRADIFYDSNNTNFYVNPDGTTSANFNGDINFGGELNMVSTTAENKYIDHHGDLRFRYSNNSSFFNERLRIAGASNFTECTGSFRSPVFYDKNNTGYYADFGSTGDSIRAAGDIVAFYSDDRLKDRGDNIANALDKVQSLNGFHYTANETAQKFGYKAHPQVGVSAQEVEAVLPEVVKDAAIGHGYKTVDYAKLVPLLIEAIKELKAEVETLKKG